MQLIFCMSFGHSCCVSYGHTWPKQIRQSLQLCFEKSGQAACCVHIWCIILGISIPHQRRVNIVSVWSNYHQSIPTSRRSKRGRGGSGNGSSSSVGQENRSYNKGCCGGQKVKPLTRVHARPPIWDYSSSEEVKPIFVLAGLQLENINMHINNSLV